MMAQRPGNSAEIAAAKKDLRARTRARRRSLSVSQRQHIDAQLQRHLLSFLSEHVAPGAMVGAYCPMATEPGGVDLPEVVRREGYRVLLPRIVPATEPDLEWVEYSGELQVGPMGLQEPTGTAVDAPLGELCELLFVPALAVDGGGNRLGQGGGFYDRQVAKGRLNVQRCAVIDGEEFHFSVPHAPHDLSVDFIISDHGLMRAHK